jgi:hypothetical protein
MIRSKKTLWAPIKSNRDGIRHLSIKEDLNIYEVLIDYIGEKTSVSNEPICDKCKFDFDKHSGQKLFFELFKSASDLFINQNSFKKTCDTCHQPTQFYQTILTSNKKITKKTFSMSEGEHRGDKLSCSKIKNKLVKNKSPVLLLRLIKLGSEF